MSLRLFGFEIKRPEDEKQLEAFSPPINDDGAVTVGSALGGTYGTVLDLNNTSGNEATLVTRYRQVAQQPEVHDAIVEIVNDAVSISDSNKIVEVIPDEIKGISENTKKRIIEEFDNILKLLDFSNKAYEMFSNWYIDGRINYHVMVDEDDLRAGIKELRYIDPRKLQFIREMEEDTLSVEGIPLKKIKNEYYIYNEYGHGASKGSAISGSTSGGYKIAKDSIVRATSGLLSEDNAVVHSYLHKSMKHMTMLRTLEDASIIYTMTRAPERRIFYVDVGNLPKAKAEQYLQSMMTQHKNKLVYNSATGDVSDKRNMMTMTEDFWFPRREGSRSTEIDTLASSGNLLEDGFLDYFLKRVYKSLGVPSSRLEPENNYSFGRPTEISREEVKFSKFITRLRAKFSSLFDELLEKQLILKGVIVPGEWAEIKESISYKFHKDNYFEELKESEIMAERLRMLGEVSEYEGSYFSKKWIQKNVLKMSDDDIEQMEQEKAAEPAPETDDGLDGL